MRVFRLYEFVVPLLFFPLAYLAWLNRYNGDHRLVLFMIAMPIIFAYVLPVLGTN